MNQVELQNALEKLVDATQLSEVLSCLANVCYAKGEHLRSNWQDDATAKAWECAGEKIDRLGSNVRGAL